MKYRTGRRSMSRLMSLLLFAVLVGAAAFLASGFTSIGLGSWYEGLSKPFFQPPSYLFGPVWTFIYILIAVSGWILYRHVGSLDHSVIVLFFLQLVLNSAWSAFFFVLKTPALALVEIIALLAVITAYIYRSWRYSRLASALFTPYWLW
ncbi:MAG: TspO/MBR family protein, partial [Candidatus Nanohaloarchaea archaeon]|nr:TspO/MBR family protein [Candidatus Nanohaloarchaea archaeon]